MIRDQYDIDLQGHRYNKCFLLYYWFGEKYEILNYKFTRRKKENDREDRQGISKKDNHNNETGS